MKKAIQITDITSREDQWNIKFNHYSFNSSDFAPIALVQSGHKSSSPPGFMSEPAIYDHYVLHYVTSGKGTFFIDNQQLTIEAGECFLIPPFKFVQYQADLDKPWTYYWIGFSGYDASKILYNSGFSELYKSKPASTNLESILHKIVYLNVEKHQVKYSLLGYVYLFFAELADSNKRVLPDMLIYYNKAISFIENNYSNPHFSVEDIALHVGVTRSYLYKIFMQVSQLSISDTITNIRLSKALSLLENNTIPLKEIAYSVGFNSQTYFSQRFKKHFNVSPTQYKQKHNGN